jgi:hypothetical protein
MRRVWAWGLIGLLVAVIAGGVLLAVEDGEGPEGPAAVTHVDGPDADTKRDDPLPLTEAQVDEAEAIEAPGPYGTEIDQPLREPEDPSRTPPGVLEGPLAAQEFPGCRTRFVRNFSSRNGRRPEVIVWHQTVSYDREGYADQAPLIALANRPSSFVSWHFLIGRLDGLCSFNVPLHMKAWTQGNANPVAFGIEVQAYGNERRYVESRGAAKLIAVTRLLGRRFNIPMRKGLVRFDANCNPTVVRRGIVEHSDLGRCGGGHGDVVGKPPSGWITSNLIRQAAQGSAAAPKNVRVWCRKLDWWRRAGRPSGKALQNARTRKDLIRRRGFRCVRGVAGRA